jgi:hypothetical protein
MQTALLIFIVVFALAIGFFLGIFILSLNTPLTKKLTKTDDQPLTEQQEDVSDSEIPAERKPNAKSRLILRVWKEEGKPPVYDLEGTFLPKEQLPKEILHVITIHEEESLELPDEEITPEPTFTPPPEDKEIPEEDEEEEKMLSVIDEVNEILQKKLLGSPLAGKGIHLMENHNREIRFWVGLNSYDDVDQIPDPDIRKIIDDSVREWEKNRE